MLFICQSKKLFDLSISLLLVCRIEEKPLKVESAQGSLCSKRLWRNRSIITQLKEIVCFFFLGGRKTYFD
jgi:hypothetical protein